MKTKMNKLKYFLIMVFMWPLLEIIGIGVAVITAIGGYVVADQFISVDETLIENLTHGLIMVIGWVVVPLTLYCKVHPWAVKKSTVNE